MKKIKIGVIFGGMSTENEVSCISGKSVIQHLNKEKYDIFSIFIDKQGNWFEIKDIQKGIDDREIIVNITEYLKKFDVVFPVLHGLYGEDGTIQGLFELLKIKYVGCRVLASSVGMDKAYTKIIFNKAQLNQAQYIYLKKEKDEYVYVDENLNYIKMNLDKLIKIITEKIRFPMFVKPSNSGSSVGINKSNNIEELKEHIKYATTYDNKILVEEGIKGKEIECAVLGTENVITSCVGEIKPADEFYSYDAKYNNTKSRIIIPSTLSKEKEEEVRAIAEKAFKAIDGKGISRVDFFVEDKTEKVYINEINTLPGFTSISMYPKLFEASGIKYEDLLDKVIEDALI